MILFLHPSQDKYSINCSSLRHKAKLHFTNTDYFLCLFSNMMSPVPLKVGTTMLIAHSADIPNPSRIFLCISAIYATQSMFGPVWSSPIPASCDYVDHTVNLGIDPCRFSCILVASWCLKTLAALVIELFALLSMTTVAQTSCIRSVSINT